VARVRVVLTNWRRPENVLKIAKAFRAQTVPVELVVVDNSGNKAGVAIKKAFDLSDDVISFSQNAGPSCRFIGGLFADTEYVQFHDDDAAPSPRCVEYYLKTASDLDDKFGVLGSLGRRATWKSYLTSEGFGREPRYSTHNVLCKKKIYRVDFTCRGMFVRRESLWCFEKFRERLLRHCPEYGRRMTTQDDIMLAVATKFELGLGAYLVKKMPSDYRALGTELNDKHAYSKKAGHREIREGLIQAAYKMGWRGWWHNGKCK